MMWIFDAAFIEQKLIRILCFPMDTARRNGLLNSIYSHRLLQYTDWNIINENQTLELFTNSFLNCNDEALKYLETWCCLTYYCLDYENIGQWTIGIGKLGSQGYIVVSF
jgi:hypothetical protein